MVDVARGRWPGDMQRAAGVEAEAGAFGAIADELLDRVRGFIRQRPEAAALWALGFGLLLGWKLRGR